MCPSAPRVCSEPGGQKPVLSLSLDLISVKALLQMAWVRAVTFFDHQLTHCGLVTPWIWVIIGSGNDLSHYLMWLNDDIVNWTLSKILRENWIKISYFLNKFQNVVCKMWPSLNVKVTNGADSTYHKQKISTSFEGLNASNFSKWISNTPTVLLTFKSNWMT